MPALEARLPHTPDEDRQHLLEAVIPTHRLFVAERAGVVVGFASLQGDALGHLYVAPEAQRRGVGGALLAHAKSLSPERLTLFTHRANRRARAFYEARGFRAVKYGTSPPPENEPDVAYEWTRRPVRDPAVVARRIVLAVALAALTTSFLLPTIWYGPERIAGYRVFVLSLAAILTGWLQVFPHFLAAVATAYLPVHLIRALGAPPSRGGLTFLGVAIALGRPRRSVGRPRPRRRRTRVLGLAGGVRARVRRATSPPRTSRGRDDRATSEGLTLGARSAPARSRRSRRHRPDPSRGG